MDDTLTVTECNGLQSTANLQLRTNYHGW